MPPGFFLKKNFLREKVGNAHFKSPYMETMIVFLGESFKPLYMSQGREKRKWDFLILMLHWDAERQARAAIVKKMA